MFVGHYAVALALKPRAPRVNLAWLLAAGCGADILWTLFLALGLEHARIVPGLSAVNPLELHDYPWSHSLLMTALAAAAAGGLWRFATRDGRGALALGLAWLSHWPLDWASHIPDMPLWPGGGLRLGLGLWNSLPLTLAVEGTLWLAGLALYARATRGRDRIGRWGFALWALLLSGLYLASFGGPPPPSMTAVVIVNAGLSLAVFAATAWIDRHRAPREARRGSDRPIN